MTAEIQSKIGPAVLERADEYARRFAAARPFRHVCIDGFLSDELARRLAATFPAFDERLAIDENGAVGAKAVHENVTGLGADWCEVDRLVQSAAFRALVSRITGVPDLRYDPYYFGGGTHENLHGQSLDAHVDFNYHPVTRQHRRLNLIVYLTEEWRDEWGGSIRLHRDPYLPPELDEIVTITPAFNRCVIFETNEHSWHGFPRIDLPADKRHLSRRSFALYYYTDSRPLEQLGPEHSTIYVEQHLPDDFQAGMVLSGEQLQQLRNLLASRDQHLRRLYGNIKQLYTDLNRYKEELGLQLPPAVAPEVVAGLGDERPADDPTAFAIQLQGALARRDAQLRRLQARVAELENSTSWRITAPLRALKRRLMRWGGTG